MSDERNSAVGRVDAAIAVLLASIVPVGALALSSAIPAVILLRAKEQAFIWWAFEAAALFLVGVAYGVLRRREGTAGVRLRSIFLLPALYAAIWMLTFILIAIVLDEWGGHLGPLIAMLGSLLGAQVGAAFAALVAIRPSSAISRRRSVRLGALSAIPALVLFAAWFAADRISIGARSSTDYGVIAGFVVTVLLLAVGCASVTAPLLQMLTMRADRS